MKQILVDSSNQWYRAYCATPLKPPGGPVMIMSYMIKSLCERFGINNIVMCWDKGHSGREELDPNYKSNRTPVPGVWEDIVWMKKFVSSLGITSAYLEGYEADDIIASLSKNFVGETVIVSSDKDFYQLIDDDRDIKVLRPKQTVQGGKTIPERIVKEKDVIDTKDLWCSPNKVKLVKAFKGDVSDNIPKLCDSEGKTVRWSKNFKEPFYKIINLPQVLTVEDFYKHVSFFDNKYQTPLDSFKKQAEINYEIVSMKRDLEVKIHNPKPSKLWFEDLCEELEIEKVHYDYFRK